MKMVWFNGAFLPADQAIYKAGSPGVRYGEGLFETIRLHQREMPLLDLHWDRLVDSMQQLGIPQKYDFISSKNAILDLSDRNGLSTARVRIATFSESTGPASMLIETEGLDETGIRNRDLSIGICPSVRKTQDPYARLKSANYLPYRVAGRFAQEKGLDEALVLNSEEAIADGSKTNLFIIEGRRIITTGLDQGCVAGVFRRYLLSTVNVFHLDISEEAISVDRLHAADEVFLTNALRGIRTVGSFGNKTYQQNRGMHLARNLNSTIWS